jgi:hypothetical protein
MAKLKNLNSIIQAFQSLSSEEILAVLQSLPKVEISQVKAILNLLEPRQRVEVAKHLIFSTKPEYIEDLKYAITTEYDLRQSRGALVRDPLPRLGKTKLEIKRIPYRHKNVCKRYTYVYVMRYRDNAFRCLGRLLQTEDSHEYQYTLLENGGLAFSEREVFKLTSVQDPEQVKLIRLLRLEAPPLDYEFRDDGPLELQVPLVYEALHPETHQPQSQQRVDFPACVTSGIFKKQLWQIETLTSPALFDSPLAGSGKRSPSLHLAIPAQDAQSTIAALTYWQRLSEVGCLVPWYLSFTVAAYRLVHGQGQMLLEFHIRDQVLWSSQSPQQLSQYFQELGLALVAKSQQGNDAPYFYQEGTKLVAGLRSLQRIRGTSPPELLQWLLDSASRSLSL